MGEARILARWALGLPGLPPGSANTDRLRPLSSCCLLTFPKVATCPECRVL